MYHEDQFSGSIVAGARIAPVSRFAEKTVSKPIPQDVMRLYIPLSQILRIQRAWPLHWKLGGKLKVLCTKTCRLYIMFWLQIEQMHFLWKQLSFHVRYV